MNGQSNSIDFLLQARIKHTEPRYRIVIFKPKGDTNYFVPEVSIDDGEQWNRILNKQIGAHLTREECLETFEELQRIWDEEVPDVFIEYISANGKSRIVN